MTPYEIMQVITTDGADEIVAIACPGRCVITRVAALNLSDTTLNIDFYNRAFTSDAVNIRKVWAPSADYTTLVLKSRLPVKVGDPVVISGTDGGTFDSSASSFDGRARVLAVRSDGYEIDVDLVDLDDETMQEGTGTVALDIVDDEQNIYRALPRLEGNPFAESWNRVTFVNMDPLANLNIGVKRYIYVQPKAAGTYQIAIRCEESIGTGA